jgi:hypothetical protein
MIADHLDVSDDPDAPGATAFEAVVALELENCRLLERLELVEQVVTGCILVYDETDHYWKSEQPKD